LADILYGFLPRAYIRVSAVHFASGYVPVHHHVERFAQAIRAIGAPIPGQPAAAASLGTLLTLLSEVTALFDPAPRPKPMMLQQTM
ncbi:ubiquinone biosynthesis protein UbiB, partial [Rhizobium brockwellii]